MAILKHIASKNPNYGAALEYLISSMTSFGKLRFLTKMEIVLCGMSFI